MNKRTEATTNCQSIFFDDDNDVGAEENIKTAQIVYIFGPSGAGKTFTGDYMHVVHEYHHVDGDYPLKHMTMVPEYKEMMEKMCFDDDWDPHYSELARLTLEAAKEHKEVVLSHATGKNEQRDHVVKKFVEGGASMDNITLIQLTIDPKVKARDYYYRSKRQAEQAGMTITEAWKTQYPEFEGEVTEEMYVEWFLNSPDNLASGDDFEDHPDAIMVDISGRDVTHFDNVDKALGLTRSSDLTYKGVCAEVLPIDVARDKEAMENCDLEAAIEFGARVAAKYSKGDNSLEHNDNETREEEEKLGEMRRSVSSVGELEVSVRSLSVG